MQGFPNRKAGNRDGTQGVVICTATCIFGRAEKGWQGLAGRPCEQKPGGTRSGGPVDTLGDGTASPRSQPFVIKESRGLRAQIHLHADLLRPLEDSLSSIRVRTPLTILTSLGMSAVLPKSFRKLRIMLLRRNSLLFTASP